MPIATPDVYAEMIDRAKSKGFAYPAINVTSSQTLNAALKGFADAGSDGIIQFSTGGAEYGSGQYVKDMVTGAVALAEFAHVVAAKYPVNIAIHTDHCPKDKLDTYVRPLLEISRQRVANGQDPLFQSHMWDGSAETLADNLSVAQELLERARAAKIILEVEITPTGGEEDGVTHEINDSLYTTVDDAIRTAEALGLGDKGRDRAREGRAETDEARDEDEPGDVSEDGALVRGGDPACDGVHDVLDHVESGERQYSLYDRQRDRDERPTRRDNPHEAHGAP